MISYSATCWGFSPLWMCGGSVFPKSFSIAIPSALLAVLLNIYVGPSESEKEQLDGIWKIWSGYTTVLGFLIVFRNNQAYTRFWEGATLINQVRGEWFNAVSCLIAFSTTDPARSATKQEFQHTLVRLASILYCFALQQICDLDDNALEIIKIDTMDRKSVDLLANANDKCELVIQWMQRLIVQNAEGKILDIAPPILSRAFQELSRGIVKLNDVRKISEIPVPFPYAQMLLTMLILHWFITPMMCALSLYNPGWAATMTFVSVASYWSLYYIALEIDQPFGEDRNDLPVREMQKDFNRSLLNLLDDAAQTVPTFSSSDTIQIAQMGSDVEKNILGHVPWESQATSRKAHLKMAGVDYARDSQGSRCGGRRQPVSLISHGAWADDDACSSAGASVRLPSAQGSRRVNPSIHEPVREEEDKEDRVQGRPSGREISEEEEEVAMAFAKSVPLKEKASLAVPAPAGEERRGRMRCSARSPSSASKSPPPPERSCRGQESHEKEHCAETVRVPSPPGTVGQGRAGEASPSNSDASGSQAQDIGAQSREDPPVEAHSRQSPARSSSRGELDSRQLLQAGPPSEPAQAMLTLA